MKILVVEDDVNLSKTLCDTLSGIGETDTAYNGETALDKMLNDDYDIVILDIMLPRMNGTEVLRSLRRKKPTPVIVLSAIAMLDKKIEMLNLGADDYVVKPFSRDELIARVNATMRRYNKDFKEMKYRFGDFALDYTAKMVTFGGERLPITGKQYEVLEMLIKNKEIIVTRQQLFDSVCGFYSDTIEQVIEVYIYRLRKILSQYGMSSSLKTVKTIGYMWTENTAPPAHLGGGAVK